MKPAGPGRCPVGRSGSIRDIDVSFLSSTISDLAENPKLDLKEGEERLLLTQVTLKKLGGYTNVSTFRANLVEKAGDGSVASRNDLAPRPVPRGEDAVAWNVSVEVGADHSLSLAISSKNLEASGSGWTVIANMSGVKPLLYFEEGGRNAFVVSVPCPSHLAPELEVHLSLSIEALKKDSGSLKVVRTKKATKYTGPPDPSTIPKRVPRESKGDVDISFLRETVKTVSLNPKTTLVEGKERLLLTQVSLSSLDGYQQEFSFRASVITTGGEITAARHDLNPRPVAKGEEIVQWSTTVEVQADQQLIFSFSARNTEVSEGSVWSTIATATVKPLAYFEEGGRSAFVVSLPLSAPLAENMVLLLSLSIESERLDSDSLKVEGKAHSTVYHGDQAAAVKREGEDALFKAVLEDNRKLTLQQCIIVKDTWNKALPWFEIIIEFITERFLIHFPSIRSQLGASTDNLEEMFTCVFDLCVRSLTPETEEIGRESYRSMHEGPAAKKRLFEDLDGYLKAFAMLEFGIEHWVDLRDLFITGMGKSPYAEEYELEDLELRKESSCYIFFTTTVMKRAFQHMQIRNEMYSDPKNAEIVRKSFEEISQKKKECGFEFYEHLFSTNPGATAYFNRSNMDALSGHLFDALETMVSVFHDFRGALPLLHTLGSIHASRGIDTVAYGALGASFVAIFIKHMPGFAGDKPENAHLQHLWIELLGRASFLVKLPMLNHERMLHKAYEWSELMAREFGWSETALIARKEQIRNDVVATGTYSHTEEELIHGARVAWRNSAKCIGRIAWNTLMVRDCRHVTEPAEMMSECLEHQRLATADGTLKAVMTIFRPQKPGERMGPRFWNVQLVRFACYELPDGTTMGDKSNIKLTKALIEFGWKPPEPRTEFDVLPIVIQTPEHGAHMFTLPEEYAVTCLIEHPDFPNVAKLGLRWCVVPTISAFTLDLGGIRYVACPFNGWFMDTEVGRDLFDTYRYDKGEAVAKAMNLDTNSDTNFWRDKAWLEFNLAIMHSFRKNMFSIVDHMTASKQFIVHDLREKRAGRECPAQWSWVVPPISSGLTQVFGHEMRDFVLEPQYRYQAEIWEIEQEGTSGDQGSGGDVEDAKKLLILYASETGATEGFARLTAKKLKPCLSTVLAMSDKMPADIVPDEYKLVILLTSTFGDGGHPGNGKTFIKALGEIEAGALKGVDYCVLACGSTVYGEDFCKAGVVLDRAMTRSGATRVIGLEKADELRAQAATVDKWIDRLKGYLGVTTRQGAQATDDDEWKVTLLDATHEKVLAAKDRAPSCPQGFHLCPVTRNSELLEAGEEPEHSTRFLEFDIGGEGCDLVYHTGDHAAIIPENSDKAAYTMCSIVKLDYNQWFSVAETNLCPMPAKIGDIFKRELDLVISHDMLEPLLKLLLVTAQADETDPGASTEAQKLQQLVDSITISEVGVDGVTKNTNDLVSKYHTVYALLASFPVGAKGFTMRHALRMLKKIKPRFYSIASGHELHPRKVQLTIALLLLRTPKDSADPSPRRGMCSSYLKSRELGEHIRLKISTSSFRLPLDTTAPVIMVGPGTGISPMLGFLQAREAFQNAGKQLGECAVYFGCRRESSFLHRSQMREWNDKKIITDLRVAMSRADPNDKVYVQTIMERDRQGLWDYLSNPKCHFYVCGDSQMGVDVFKELLRSCHQVGGMSRIEVVDFMDKMKKEGRLQKDTWGVVLHADDAEVAAKFAEEEYDKGATWLKAVQEARQLQAEGIANRAPVAEATADAGTTPTKPTATDATDVPVTSNGTHTHAHAPTHPNAHVMGVPLAEDPKVVHEVSTSCGSGITAKMCRQM